MGSNPTDTATKKTLDCGGLFLLGGDNGAMLLYQGEPELPYDSFDVIVDALAAASQDRVIVVEGVGVTQARMRSALDFKIWVQTDAEVAKERGLLRDLAEQQSWLVADFRISGQA